MTDREADRVIPSDEMIRTAPDAATARLAFLTYGLIAGHEPYEEHLRSGALSAAVRHPRRMLGSKETRRAAIGVRTLAKIAPSHPLVTEWSSGCGSTTHLAAMLEARDRAVQVSGLPPAGSS